MNLDPNHFIYKLTNQAEMLNIKSFNVPINRMEDSIRHLQGTGVISQIHENVFSKGTASRTEAIVEDSVKMAVYLCSH